MKAILLGMALTSVGLIPGTTVEYVAPKPTYQVVVAEVSAYTSSVDETDDEPFITASGSETRHGVLACPSRLEFGTKVEIEGRVYICEDRMNKRFREKENYDIWMSSKDIAYEWGRKTITIKIYE